ncbi:hypothetical protein F4780DRAFT_127176 [Xylariomycetidae sp. FL0641]|nr:hypothetical protein F4780DRAFT_127176 [Xylariomycetidae sp. FL0641]
MSSSSSLTPEQAARMDENRGPTVVAVASLFIGLCTVAVTLRFAARLNRRLKIGLDDWLSVAALVFVIGFCVTCILSVNYGMGKHKWAVDPTQVWKILQIGYFNALINFGARFSIKMSLITLYRRVFTMRIVWFRYALYALTVYVTGVCVGGFFAAMLQCVPPSHFWEKYNPGLATRPEGYCGVDNAALVISTSVFAVVADIILFILAMTMLSQLRLKRPQRLAFILIFGTGALAIGASITHMVFAISATRLDADTTWITAQIYLWTAVESSVGLICACLPTLGPVIVTANKAIAFVLSEISLLGRSSSLSDGPSHATARYDPAADSVVERDIVRRVQSTTTVKPASEQGDGVMTTDEWELTALPKRDSHSLHD